MMNTNKENKNCTVRIANEIALMGFTTEEHTVLSMDDHGFPVQKTINPDLKKNESFTPFGGETKETKNGKPIPEETESEPTPSHEISGIPAFIELKMYTQGEDDICTSRKNRPCGELEEATRFSRSKSPVKGRIKCSSTAQLTSDQDLARGEKPQSRHKVLRSPSGSPTGRRPTLSTENDSKSPKRSPRRRNKKKNQATAAIAEAGKNQQEQDSSGFVRGEKRLICFQNNVQMPHLYSKNEESKTVLRDNRTSNVVQESPRSPIKQSIDRLKHLLHISNKNEANGNKMPMNLFIQPLEANKDESTKNNPYDNEIADDELLLSVGRRSPNPVRARSPHRCKSPHGSKSSHHGKNPHRSKTSQRSKSPHRCISPHAMMKMVKMASSKSSMTSSTLLTSDDDCALLNDNYSDFETDE